MGQGIGSGGLQAGGNGVSELFGGAKCFGGEPGARQCSAGVSRRVRERHLVWGRVALHPSEHPAWLSLPSSCPPLAPQTAGRSQTPSHFAHPSRWYGTALLRGLTGLVPGTRAERSRSPQPLRSPSPGRALTLQWCRAAAEGTAPTWCWLGAAADMSSSEISPAWGQLCCISIKPAEF